MEKAPCMKVKCSVLNCSFNEKKMCHADALEINAMGGKYDAEISDETCCTTFKENK